MEASFRNLVAGRSVGLGPALLRAFLAGSSVPYRIAVSIRNRLYDSGILPAVRVPVPVVSIGNLTLGGTGKTPFVEYVSRWYLSRGKRVVILSRGYSGAGGRNDEALLLETNLPGVPHLQGPDRAALAERAVAEFLPDVIVLDDGFQHRRLARDLDIVLIDSTEPFGHGHLFPRGLLREPLTSLSRAELIVLSRANQRSEEDLAQISRAILSAAGEKSLVLAQHRPIDLWSSNGQTAAVDFLAGKSVAAFCGIGNPDAFWETLNMLGCHVVGTRTFPDHHRYAPRDVDSLRAWIDRLRPDLVVTTEKDLVKIPLSHLGQCPMHALRIELLISKSSNLLDQTLARVLDDSHDASGKAA